MRNFVQNGDVLTLTAPYTRTSGQAAMVGSIFGVAASDVTSGDEGEFQVTGVFDLAKTSAQAWTQGDKVYWNASTKLVSNLSADGPLVGVATEDAADPSSTGRVRLGGGGAPAEFAEGQQAAIADLTDNSGGATADGTIGAVTQPTALTDNGGGTADATVASMAAVTAPTTGTLGGTANGALETVGATNGGDVSGAIMNNFQEFKTFADNTATWMTTTQNNMKEVTTTLAAQRTADIALTDAVKELSTKLNAALAALRAAGIIAT